MFKGCIYDGCYPAAKAHKETLRELHKKKGWLWGEVFFSSDFGAVQHGQGWDGLSHPLPVDAGGRWH